MPHEETESPAIVLPSRQCRDDYVHHPVPQNIVVPAVSTGEGCETALRRCG